MSEYISAKVIKQSVNSETRDIITTFLLTYPRIIHAELLTHRIFSRNSASSRAIPVKTELERLRKEHFVPDQWDKNCKGMSPSTVIDEIDAQLAEEIWLDAFDAITYSVEKLANLGIHKQLANRLAEPFQIMQVVLTTTNVENFLELRDDSKAQSQIQTLAQRMREAFLNGLMQKLNPGEWHLPFVTPDLNFLSLKEKIYVSIARSARVSYYLHDGKTQDYKKDLLLAESLIEDHHMSPTEHAAMAFPQQVQIGNFIGFMQYRKFIKNETYDNTSHIPIYNQKQALSIAEKLHLVPA